MTDLNAKTTLKLPHDGYLKLFQLQKPNLQSSYLHDVLMIDEGQDMNPAMLDIFSTQKTNKIIVGDPNQQTNRGAINALNTIEAKFTYHLTQSFRFGPTIASVANTCLEILQKVKLQTLVGGKKKDCLLNREDIKNVSHFKPIAIIARTNIELFNEIVKMVCDNPNPPSCTMAGGLQKYNFDHLLDFWYLYRYVYLFS